MGSHEPVITLEAVRRDLIHHILDMVADLHRIGRREDEVRNTNPSFVAGLCGLQLELLRDLCILASIVVGALDPDHREIGTLSGGLWGDQHDRFGDSCRHKQHAGEGSIKYH